MKLAFKIVSPSNTGAPDYNICGQAAPALSHSGLSLKMEFKGTTIYDEPDVSMGTLPALPITVSGRTISAITYHPTNGFVLTIDSELTIGLEDDFKITLSKTGYQSYSNTFKLFDYDFNTNIYLINNTNNLDINGYQTRAFSKFYAYRKPFTDQIFYYNVVGTQGNIVYSNVTDTLNPIALFTGQNGIVCASTGIDIKQTITVSDVYGALQNTCESTNTIAYINWLPIVNVSVDCSPACNDTCVSNIGTGTYTTTVDVSNLGSILVDNVDVYPYHNTLFNFILHKVYDYQGILLEQSYTLIQLGAAGTDCVGSPIVKDLPTLPLLGDVVIQTCFVVLTEGTLDGDSEPIIDLNETPLISCCQTTTISRCNWLTITETENCGEFIVSNCSVDDTILTIKQLQDDKTFLTISTTTITALSTLTVNLITDGVYSFEVPSKVDGETDIFIVTNDCSLKACLFTKLGTLMCTTCDTTCIASNKDYYDFNAFVLNLHTYYALLNEEFNYNYIYKAIDINKLNDLYTIKQYLDNLATYCVAPCGTCNCSK